MRYTENREQEEAHHIEYVLNEWRAAGRWALLKTAHWLGLQARENPERILDFHDIDPNHITPLEELGLLTPIHGRERCYHLTDRAALMCDWIIMCQGHIVALKSDDGYWANREANETSPSRWR